MPRFRIPTALALLLLAPLWNLRARATTSESPPTAPPPFLQWELWWQYNAPRLLDLRSRIRNVPSAREVRQRVLPALLLAVKERSSTLVDSAVLALARSVPAEDRDQVLPDILGVVGHEDAYAKKAGTLALGVLGHPGARPVLLDLLRDGEAGRKHAGTPQGVPEAVRGFAALALGMIGQPEDADAILAVLRDPAVARAEDLQSCATLALSMFPARHDVIVPYVRERLADASHPPRLAAYLPLALAKLDPEPTFAAARDLLLAAVVGEGTNEELLRSCIIALGKLAPFGDEEVVGALFNAIQEVPDASACYLACLALGEMGARDQAGFLKEPEPHLNLLYALLNEMARPRFERGQSPWIAFALTIYAQGHLQNRKAKEFVESIATEIHVAFNGDAKESARGAYALCLGLLGAEPAAEDLLKAYDKTRDDAFKGYLAVALGLLGHKAAIPSLRKDIEQAKAKDHLRLELATALRLFDDDKSLKPLVELLSKARSIVDYAALAKVVARLGGDQAIEPLAQLLLEQENPELERAYAAVALGIVAEQGARPWGARISVDLNYLSATPAITEILTIM